VNDAKSFSGSPSFLLWDARFCSARFPEGTLKRIDGVLEDGENRSDLVREAVEKELKRREKRQG
jgi:metal-responsive CopG/Arc/MetJ family transcriptional regulator